MIPSELARPDEPIFPLLQVEQISKSFPGVLALQDVSLHVNPGEVLGLVGENGAGKSTLMKILYGVFQPDSGQILIDGKPVQNRWREQSEVPATSPVSDALSKDLKKRGFRFVGSTIIYAHMQATGMVNDHIRRCFRHAECRVTA